MRRRASVLAGFSVLLAVAAAGCGGSSTSTTRTQSEAPRSLDPVSLQQSDVLPTYIVKLYPEGNQVTGQVSLDLCNGSFPSEAKRIQRHQVGTSDPAGKSAGLSTEAVVYDSPASAQQALTELRSVRAQCPDTYQPSTVQGEPPTKYVFAPAPDQTWPAQAGVDRYAVDATISAPDGRSVENTAVYQVHGSTLVALYVRAPTGSAALSPSAGGIQGLATKIAQHLATTS